MTCVLVLSHTQCMQGFPTLLLMKDPEVYEDATPVLFQGERNFEGMLEFLVQEGVLSTPA